MLCGVSSLPSSSSYYGSADPGLLSVTSGLELDNCTLFQWTPSFAAGAPTVQTSSAHVRNALM